MNETLGSLRTRLNEALAKYSPTQKRNMTVTALFLLAAFGITLWVTTRPHYVTIMSGLDNKSLGQVQTQLQTLKIPNQINGTSVLVPAADANTARAQLAVAGLPQSGYNGYSQVSTSPIGMTDQVFNLQVLNALQENLNQTIDTMNGVENAQVFIVQPQQALFATQQPTGAKASVFVQVGAGNQLSAAQVAGIQTLVSHSVIGMAPANVSVVDQNGVTLSGATNGSAAVGTSQELALRQSLESQLQQTISSELNQILGYGNAVVAVNYDITLNRVSTSSTKYLPASGQQTGLIASQQKSTQTSSTPNTAAGGLTGQSSSNPGLPTYSTTSGTGASTSQSTSSTTNYDNGIEQQQVVSDPMQINSIHVSVVLNAKDPAVNKIVETQIRQFVAGAIGASSGSTTRSISVSAVPFQPTQIAGLTPSSAFAVPTWAYAAAGLVVVGGGVLLVMRRRRKPADAPTSTVAGFEGPRPTDDLDMDTQTEDEQMRDQLVRLANQKPDEFVNLLRTWLVSE